VPAAQDARRHRFARPTDRHRLIHALGAKRSEP